MRSHMLVCHLLHQGDEDVAAGLQMPSVPAKCRRGCRGLCVNPEPSRVEHLGEVRLASPLGSGGIHIEDKTTNTQSQNQWWRAVLTRARFTLFFAHRFWRVRPVYIAPILNHPKSLITHGVYHAYKIKRALMDCKHYRGMFGDPQWRPRNEQLSTPTHVC